MGSLKPSQFAKYFEAVHGSTPFPWQARLLEEVAANGRWPDQLAIPTGCGKTAVLDVAVFHLALQAGGERTAPLRIISVVDRRTVVDQTFERATRIRDQLAEASSGVLAEVRARLASLSRDQKPLAVALLRGGMARDESWARSPDQPTLIVSTVDQVGSRLLFRGYGVSDSMKPVHAGLLANDALYLLDEVHLSNPFAQTLDEVFGRYAGWCEAGRGLPARSAFVKLSATPRSKSAKQFALDDDDRKHPLIQRRLKASKPAELVPVKVKSPVADDDAMVSAFTARAVEAAVAGQAVAVVVNRVKTARRVHQELSGRLKPPARLVLLTGRMRALDRDELNASLAPRVRAGRTRSPEDAPIVVVSTQCIEAGADYDFDVLITECASLDALRQRFGRLNRLGDAEKCRGVIVARSDYEKEEDPIYGDGLSATWKYLQELETPDFGLEALKLPARTELEKLLPPEEEAPVLLPHHLDFWVQTRPIPEPDPDVSLWLHGPKRDEPEVQLVWRADVPEAALDEANAEALRDRIEACPPSSPEGLSLPVSAVRRWLERARERDAIADVEGGLVPEEEARERAPEAPPRRAFRWRGDDSGLVGPGDIRGGDTLVVPSSYGGLSAGNWAPDSAEPVSDLGERAHAVARGRAVLRITTAASEEQAADVSEEGESPEQDRELAAAWIESAMAEDTSVPWRRVLLDHLRHELERKTCRIERLPRLPGETHPLFALIGRKPLNAREMEAMRGGLGDAGSTTTEDDTASFTGVAVKLRKHLAGVEAFARDYATRSGLPPDLVNDLALAGAWHDTGKADQRFQVMLHGGSRFLAEVADEPLAKSSLPGNDRRYRELARQASGYPKGARHELASVALMLASTRIRERAKDFDLVLHLVASHHGWCRPLAPVVVEESPIEVSLEMDGEPLKVSSATHLERLDSGVSERFWSLVRRYGWFGLAWMEAILRLADHRRSEHEQAEGGKRHE